jgi:beta-glucosidase
MLLSAGFSCAREEAIIYTDSQYAIEERVEDLLSRMTIEEKVAQMRIFHANKGIELDEEGRLALTDDVKDRLKNGIAGIKNPGEHLSPLEAAQLNNQLQRYIIENNRLGIPGLFVTESYNGVDAAGCTRFGRPITSAASFNTDLVKRMWDVVGREARLRGMHMCHSPEADLVRDPRFGRMSEAFGEDTYLTTEMVVNAIKGVQGDYTGLASTHMGAVAKHFAGYGQVSGGKNFAAIEVSPRTLIDEIYPPFEAAVKRARALGIMASHGDLNGIASHGNPELLTGVLRDQWGFRGYVVSDANDIARLHFFMHVAKTPEEAAIMGLKAGIDIDLYSDDAYALLPEIVAKQPELESYLDRAIRRVLRTKFILGLFDKPYVDLEQVQKGVRTATALALAREADLESIILLKNRNATLPLQKSGSKKIALLGPLLNKDTREDFAAVAGNSVSIYANQGFKLTDENRGVPKLLDTPLAIIDNMVDAARKADVVVLFLGGDAFTAKEAFFNNALGDRDSIDPVGKQDELLRRVKALGKPVIVVLKHRRTLSINQVAKDADAILDCWELSEFGDESIARVIFGEVSPSGKLPVTVPRSIGQLPFHYSQKEINYKKQYLFSEEGPLYPFGFGLSYSTFEYQNLKLSANEMDKSGEIVAQVEVSNTGPYRAKEVVQLYIKDLIGSVVRPDMELKGFQKILLLPGETRQVSFKISPPMLAFTGLTMDKVLEQGDYEVMIGGSSHQVLKARFSLSDQYKDKQKRDFYLGQNTKD